ncbi:MAG TPA: 50S ribosomal protein L9 [Deltaproteobacteria bacterium]|nr:50S ribosomal protein L9 [Deltaproteobacteria bacterium]
MKVILQEDVDNLGKAGDIVKVADGYGRNYLIPKRLAVPADVRNLRALEHDRRVIEARAKKARRGAEDLGGRLSSLSLTISAKAGEEGKLFGAVTSRDVAEALERAGVAVDRRMVLLEEPIKQVGEYRVKVKVGTDIVPEVSVRVVEE